jgi:photosystem II stability/assembly factor-like uncharacterized protein
MSTFKRLDPILAILCLILAACSLPFFGSTPTPMMETQPPVLTLESFPVNPTADIVIPPTPHVALSTPIAGLKQPLTLTSLKMFDNSNGWAAAIGDTDNAPHLLSTSDGGTTWQERTPAGMVTEIGFSNSIINFTALDLNTVWSTLSSQTPSPDLTSLITWQTTDGGETWSSSDPLPVTDLSVEFFMPDYFGFSDRNNGWLLVHNGAGMNHDYVSIFTTTNSGASWKRVVDPFMDNLYMSCSKTGLVFFDARNGWITYNCHGVKPGLDFYTSSDAGATWEPVTLPSPGYQADYWSDMQNACGIDNIVYTRPPMLTISVTCQSAGRADPERWLYTTPDNGLTWSWENTPGGYGDAFLLDPAQGWFLGHIKQQEDDASTLYVTTNGGGSWTPVKNVSWRGLPQFVDVKNGFVLASADQESAFVRTTDGGHTWSEIKAVLKP